jgi:hypothetical protein
VTLERLTRQELREIIGTPVRAKQVEWLRHHQWPHDLDYLGQPIVLRSVALERLGGTPEPEVWTMDESNVA